MCCQAEIAVRSTFMSSLTLAVDWNILNRPAEDVLP